MKPGDRVKIRTGKRGNPPIGEVVAFEEDDFNEVVVVKRNTRQGVVNERYSRDALTVIPDAA